MEIKTLTAEETRPHRLAILRPGQDISAVTYQQDEDQRTGHFAVVENDNVLGVSVLLPDPFPDDKSLAWRIRGMAVYPDHQGRGLGKKLLQACIDYAESSEVPGIWCNARTSATKFYSAFGFEVSGDEFDMPGAGPHVVMIRKAS